MKKLLSLIFITSLALTLFGQDKAYYMPVDESTYSYYNYAVTGISGPNAIPAFAAKDTITQRDSLYEIRIYPNMDQPYKYKIRERIDSISGTPRVAITLQGRDFVTESWTTISTLTWYGHSNAGTATDTIIYWTNFTTADYTGTMISDTTKIMNHATPSLKSLYFDNVSLTAANKINYRQLRLYHDANLTAQKSKFVALEIYFLK
jgi:hypothetical protein